MSKQYNKVEKRKRRRRYLERRKERYRKRVVSDSVAVQSPGGSEPPAAVPVPTESESVAAPSDVSTEKSQPSQG
ncbi:MAG: hypothetical protein N3B01_06255 [Verrucomicrobiae bacterium]|nr:hypothetical protein [Verrucomicrobiae bacterium]